jgi:hypothetical protein
MVTVIMITTIFVPVLTALSQAGQLIGGKNPWPHLQYQVAEGLKRLGVQPGDKVASLGTSFSAYWARLARVQIIAEIKSGDVPTFWAADSLVKSQIIETFDATGAKVIVAENVPSPVYARGWQRIGNTGYFAYILSHSYPE